ncbi:hypothetical protein Dsin_015511 [Dipteronia sinensis]|uniref:HTH myb-type domain-containing protein n=1 Tax=Dipteronia sinensis TaxID=43782 RepID=A0AAE0ACQ0_9ROSI|nr:hypothetical protein Dsin_015511 [Dipteronia sinensis]
MASSSELSLDCKPHSYSLLLKSFGEQADQTQKLEEVLSRLEDERLKIDAFKRELPLCMQLLSNAVEASRQQLQAYRANQGPRPVLEEFIPLKNSSSENSDKSQNMSDKSNWMTTAQLWSTGNETKPQTTITTTTTAQKETDVGGFNIISPKLGLDTKQRNGGAFLPFSKDRNSCQSPTLRSLPDLALASADNKVIMEDNQKCSDINENGSRRDNNIPANNKVGIETVKGCSNSTEGQTNSNNTTSNSNQTHRKARRCWSPDLHRRFVNALQMLGGSQVATPKQIRELMKVDGLTNDEVKSHLQVSLSLSLFFHQNSDMQGLHETDFVLLFFKPDTYHSTVHIAYSLIQYKEDQNANKSLMMFYLFFSFFLKFVHIQKYRLHTRRPSPSSQAPGGGAPQLVVLGGIWVPPEYATAAAAAHGGTPTLYHHPSSHAPPHFCAASPVPQDFYTSAPPPGMPPLPPPHHQLHHHTFQQHHNHNQLHVYKATSQGQSSPESDIRGAGDRSESIEDGKSESSSWKGESGENGNIGDQRKGLAALREDGEESNGSEITLKF